MESQQSLPADGGGAEGHVGRINLECGEILKVWIKLPSATVKGVYVEKNTSYGVRKPSVFLGR
jgi:hypothetical protein